MKTAEEMRAISIENGQALIGKIEGELTVIAQQGGYNHKYLVEKYFSQGDIASAMAALKLSGYSIEIEEASSDEFIGKLVISW